VTGTVLLAAYALAAGFGAPAALCRTWAGRSPRIALGLWLTLAASWLAAVVLAGIALAVPLTWHAASSPAAANLTGRSPAVVAGLLLAATVVLRASWYLARGLTSTRREHRAHAAFLAVAGRPDRALGAVVLDGEAPACYCLPRGRSRVVISAGALSRLSPGQIQAVLAHERAHLRGHHHRMLAAAGALARAFPAIPLLARAPGELAVLTEMTADDAAARRHDPADLAAALVALAGAGTHTTALAAGGPAAIARIQRLLAPPGQQGLPARTTRLAAGLAALAIPAAIASLPLIVAACGVITRV
jgi:Zn-dependent protease with chaperone function